MIDSPLPPPSRSARAEAPPPAPRLESEVISELVTHGMLEVLGQLWW